MAKSSKFSIISVDGSAPEADFADNIDKNQQKETIKVSSTKENQDNFAQQECRQDKKKEELNRLEEGLQKEPMSRIQKTVLIISVCLLIGFLVYFSFIK